MGYGIKSYVFFSPLSDIQFTKNILLCFVYKMVSAAQNNSFCTFIFLRQSALQ